MLIMVKVKNCFIFNEEVLFSLKADMRNKRFASNVYQNGYFHVLKVAGVYGSNNSGKTCLIKCIRSVMNVLKNEPINILPNIFSNNDICELEIRFLEQNREFKYSFKYACGKNEFVYEEFSEIIKDKQGKEREDIFFVRDTLHKNFKCKDKDVQYLLSVIAQNNILIYLVNTETSPLVNEIKNILLSFANKVDIVDLNNIPLQHTIKLLKNKSNLQEKIVNFIKNADLYLDDFKYVKIDPSVIKKDLEKAKPEEKVLDIPETLLDRICLISTYRGHEVPSLIFDSTGTKKIAALASYIIEALEQGRILIVDELDNSIHFKLTRAIVAMFNNELNTKAQLIFAVHDINLLDCKRLFRKEQIWFIHKDNNGVYVYSLAEFTANKDGVRDTSDIKEKYKKGLLGALPEPNLIQSLLDISNEQRGTKNAS